MEKMLGNCNMAIISNILENKRGYFIVSKRSFIIQRRIKMATNSIFSCCRSSLEWPSTEIIIF